MADEQDDWVPPEEPSGARVFAFPVQYKLTDLGNAERLVARWRGQIRHCDKRGKWLLWDKTRWRWDETRTIERMAQKVVRGIYAEAAEVDDKNTREALLSWAIRSEGSKSLGAMVQLAQSQEGVPIQLDELDANPWLLNATNGTIDLRTGKLLPHDPADLITRTTKIEYHPNKNSDLWWRVVADAAGNDLELLAYMQRVLGYSLIGEQLERAFFFVFGPPGTSKSTLIEACHAALGEYAQSASFESWLVQKNPGGNRGDLVRLAGARLVTSVEVRHGAKWDEGLVKQITGGDMLVFAAKYEADVAFRPSFKLLVAGNDAPAAREDDDGLWARMRRIPLTATIPVERQDRQLKRKLYEREHAEAILSWAVAGCLAYQRDGLGTCEAVQTSTEQYRAELDHFSEFLADSMVVDSLGRIQRSAVRAEYKKWAEETGRAFLLQDKDVAAKLRSAGAVDGKVLGKRGWHGIRLREATDP